MMEMEKGATQNVDVQLVEKIIQKSSQGKIVWGRAGDSYSGRSIKGDLSIDLTRQQTQLFGVSWTTFKVKRNGQEILKLENNVTTMAFIAGVTDNPVHQKVAELLLYLDSARQRQVKAAISELDQL